MLSVCRDRYSVNVICLYQYSCASLHATTAVEISVTADLSSKDLDLQASPSLPLGVSLAVEVSSVSLGSSTRRPAECSRCSWRT